MYFENGDRYDGFWVKNQMCGYGRMVQKDNTVYIGMWYGGKRNGYGFLTKENGDNFEGFWINNKREGPGSYYYNQKKKVLIGEWVEDSPRSSVYCDIEESKKKLELPYL